MEFPANYHIKVLCKNNHSDAEEVIKNLVSSHCKLNNISSKISSKSSYLSFGLDLFLQTEEQLSTIVVELKKLHFIELIF